MIEGRVGDAQWHLRNFVRKQNHAKLVEKKSSSGGGGADGSEEQSISLANGDIKTETKDLFKIVSFQKENFVHTRNLDENRYDTILW